VWNVRGGARSPGVMGNWIGDVAYRRLGLHRMAQRDGGDGYSEEELFRGFVLERVLNEGE